jgi:hypothetical protein
MTRRLPLYAAARMLLTAALVALGAVPVYVATLVLAGGLLMFAGGAWRRMMAR